MAELKAGDLFEVPYPYFRETVTLPPDDPEGTSMVEVQSWRPGVQAVSDGAYDYDQVADAIGANAAT